MRDEGRPLRTGLQGQVLNHLKLQWSRAIVVSVKEKGRTRSCQVRIKETNVSEPLMTYRKLTDDVKTEGLHCLRTSSDGTCLQAERHPVWRRRELGPGFCVQRGNLLV